MLAAALWQAWRNSLAWRSSWRNQWRILSANRSMKMKWRCNAKASERKLNGGQKIGSGEKQSAVIEECMAKAAENINGWRQIAAASYQMAKQNGWLSQLAWRHGQPAIMAAVWRNGEENAAKALCNGYRRLKAISLKAAAKMAQLAL